MISAILFSTTLFLNAFLLFLIQPIAAKMILPRVGGAPAVWNTCMLFFQLLLLAGYSYAHFLTRKIKPKFQFLFHSIILILPFLFLPLSIPEGLEPGGKHPAQWVLEVLGRYLGIPFFVLSSAAPLLQRWFASTRNRHSQDPYFLYAASNAGSFSALLAYPLWIESSFRLKTQSQIWMGGYLLAALLVLLCGLASRHPEAENQNPQKTPETIRLPVSRILRWVALAFVPSSLFLGVTTHLTTDIAAVPLLWIIPLSVYLFSFVLAFGIPDFLEKKFLLKLIPLFILPLCFMIAFNLRSPVGLLTFWHLATLFLIGTSCHLQLALDRPDPVCLTQFYLWISVGGVLGGLFNAILAPLLFSHSWEYPVALALGCALWPGIGNKGWRNKTVPAWRDTFAIASGVLFYAGIKLAMAHGLILENVLLTRSVIIGISCIPFLFAWKRPAGLALGVASLLVSGYLLALLVSFSTMTVRETRRARSFFGIYETGIEENSTGKYHTFTHGNTFHGLQSLDPARQCEPLSYFHRSGPIGQIFEMLEKQSPGAQVAIVGLGIGSLGGYAKPEQKWTFFEIDPLVQKIAEDEKYFFFLKKCVRNYEMILGDARLSLGKIPDNHYDLIILDAFSSDSLPVHLVTQEALQLYLSKLSDHGLLVFNISNRYMNMRPLFAALARSGKLTAYAREDIKLYSADLEMGKTGSEWVLIAKSEEDLLALQKDERWTPLEKVTPLKKPWSDDYSNILQLLKIS